MKPRVLFISGPLVGGGAEKVLIDVLRHFNYDRFNVDLALIHKSGVRLSDVPSKVNIIELWKEHSFHHFISVKLSTKLHSNILLAARMNSKLLRKDYIAEIAFLEGWPTKLLSLRNSSAKKLAWVHVDLSKFHNSGACYHNTEEEHSVYASMNKIISVSKDCLNGFITCFPELKSKSIYMYNPIDKEHIISESNRYIDNINDFAQDRINILTIGRLHPQKCPDRFLQAAYLAKSQELPVNFYWIGDGDLLPSLLEKRKVMGLEETVKFLGFQKNPYPYIAAADILMLPSDAEGFGLVVCEAMCLGVPVVSTKTAGPTEIIGDNECGLIADFSAESLIENIKQLINDDTLKTKLIEKGQKRVEIFTPQYMLNRLYNEL